MILTDFFLGVVGNFVARHGDPASKSLAEIIISRLGSDKPGLPPNHDVDRICRASLRQSLEMLAATIELQITQPKTLVEAFRNRFDDKGKWKPMVEWWHTDEGAWFDAFTSAISSEDGLKDFDLKWVAGAASLAHPLRNLQDPALETAFADALLSWTERNVQTGKAPSFFESWVRQGWPMAQNSPSKKISLYQAWSLFLQHHFKEDSKVSAILSADWLASIDERLTGLPLSADGISGALKEALGQHSELLTQLRDTVTGLSESYAGLEAGAGLLFTLVLEFREEVGTGFAGIRAQLDAAQSKLVVIETTVKASDQKLDTSLLNDQNIIAKLNEVLAVVTMQSAHPQGSRVVKRIASSKLLTADGAERYDQLIGRSQEKGMLTRAWRDDETRIVSIVAWGGAGKTSLVTDWLLHHQQDHWKEVDAFFDWSFYSQGTRDQSSANSEVFFNAALSHFGEGAMAASPAPAETKAACLAAAMARQRTLLVLDGLEPLQHPRKPGQDEGRLKDTGILKLLQALAQAGEPGLCVITTRVPVIDLRRWHGVTVQEHNLSHLSVRHGAALLHQAGAQYAGAAKISPEAPELLAATREVKGHAMTLQMLGGYLKTGSRKGDILRRHEVDFAKVFEGQLEGHTYNMMEAYEKWFQAEGARGLRQLAVLRMLGLFDRVADAGCIAALRKDGGIPGLSADVAALDEDDWQSTLLQLAGHRLVFVDRATQDLDAHPLLREYFAMKLREQQPESWRAAHKRLYEHLCATTKDKPDATLEDLQPLYQAVAHGCQAGLQQEACDKVYRDRIQRGGEAYSTKKLGALGSDLGAIACFFEPPWSRVSPTLIEPAQAWLLNEAAFRLRALGRLTEALEPMRAALEMGVKAEDWKQAAIRASNLSELELTLGEVAGAVGDAEQSVTYADRSGDAFMRGVTRTTHADALHQAGRRAEAEARFREAEQMQAESQPAYPLLYSVRGFKYCDLLLAAAERAAWQRCGTGFQPVGPAGVPPGVSEASAGKMPAGPTAGTAVPQACRAVSERAAQTLKIAEQNNWLLDIALDHLTLGRAALYAAILESPSSFILHPSSLASAVSGLRRAGSQHHIPRALLTRAWQRSLTGVRTGPESAQSDLDEAWEIAARGPMPLFLADIHLYRARLFGRAGGVFSVQSSVGSGEPYPWESPEADLAEARRLIVKHGYLRRMGELEDAEAALRGMEGDE